MTIEIIPEIKTFSDVESFSYLIPEKLKDKVKIGSIVSMPFGKRTIQGVVAEIREKEQKPNKFEIKEIISIDPNFSLPVEYIAIARWISEYYLCTLGEAISLFMPPTMKRLRKILEKEKMKARDYKELKLLNVEQETIFQKLKSEINSPNKKPALIRGVTGSGKTEIYIGLAKETLEQGKRVIVLVPEIMLTPQTIERFQEIFDDEVTLMHHGLSKSEKYYCYSEFQSGQKPILIGPRSALLVPSSEIGLIIIDEEQEDSYKQEQSPRYHAVTLAEKIAEKVGALLVLGTATPRTETYYRAKTGEYQLCTLEKRHHQEKLPQAEIVDLKNEFKYNNYSPISLKLQEGIRQVLSEKRQILLFLNRRGTATFVSCRDCGFVVLCPNCSIPLIYHVKNDSNFLSCHHCDYKAPVPKRCPDCQGSKIKFFGIGVDKIVSEIHKLFPEARIAKIDSTTITKKSDYQDFFRRFKKAEIDIVIGTQMIAKGLDIPGVDLVGIVSADTGLHLPHYKAGEKSFQLLTQVSGRSGRKDNQGKTIIQTYWNDASPIKYASLHDYDGFYNEEIASRQEFSYPPFKKLVRVISEDADKNKAEAQIQKVAKELSTASVDFIGPGSCFYERLHSKFRFHLIIKSDKIPNRSVSEIYKQFPNLTWDIEPSNLL